MPEWLELRAQVLKSLIRYGQIRCAILHISMRELLQTRSGVVLRVPVAVGECKDLCQQVCGDL